jgi:hypothetical protein
VGTWFGREVLGQNLIANAVAMSPIGYLYFAGGTVAVVLGFFAAGMFQRALFNLLRFSVGGAVVYLNILVALAFVENAFYSYFTVQLQMLPVLLLAQYFLFAPQRAPAQTLALLPT